MKTNTKKLRQLLTLLSICAIFNSSCQGKKEYHGLTKEEYDWLKKHTLESLVFVEGGTYMEGDVGYDDENGVHHDFGGRGARDLHKQKVESYSIGKYEVSIKEWDLFAKSTGLELGGPREEFRGTELYQPHLPASHVSWHEANDYCLWLGEVLDLPINLPSESQWEYAARSRGKAVEHATNTGKLDYDINTKGRKAPLYGYPSGHFPPNPLGIYDMSDCGDEWTKEGAVRGFGSVASVYSRAFHKKDNYGGKGIRFVVNLPKPVK